MEFYFLFLELDLGAKQVQFRGCPDRVLLLDCSQPLAEEVHAFLRHHRVMSKSRLLEHPVQFVARRAAVDEFLPQFAPLGQRA